jgi:hypothetical protein
MKLGIRERIILLNILPAEGDVTTLRIIRKLKDDMGFTEKELKEQEIVSADGKVTWKPSDYLRDIPIGEKAHDIIKDAFVKLNRENKMQDNFLDLYDLFVEKDGKVN